MTPKKRRPTHFQPGTVSLLAEILTNRPNLPDAACIGEHELFDLARWPGPGLSNTPAQAKAAALCRTCPAHAACPDALITH